MNANKDQEERLLISFSDILSVLRRSKIKILCCALLLGALGVLWILIKPICYQAEGTFREKGIKQTTLSSPSSLIHLLSGGGGAGGTESEAASLMMSRVILKDVIEKLHLQAHLQALENEETLSQLAKNNLILAWASIKNYSQPILKELYCPIKIESLKYTGEVPLAFILELEEDGRYQVYDSSPLKKVIVMEQARRAFSF